MDADAAITLGREGLRLALTIGGPILTVGVVVGLVVGLLQTATQIQDQTVSTVLKLVSMFVAVAATLPWALAKLVEFSQTLFERIPETTTVFFQ